EVEHAEDVDVELDDSSIGVRECRADLAEQQQADGRRQLNDDPELHQDERRRAPAEQGNGTENVLVGRWRKVRAQIADDLLRVAYRILREEDVVDVPGTHASLQCVNNYGAIDASEAASPIEREPVAELDGRKFRRDDDEE